MLLDVAHVPCLRYHFFSLRVAADEGHRYAGTSDSVMMDFITGEKLFFPSVGRLHFLYAYRPNALVDEIDNATIAPGPMPNNRDTLTGINDFHVAHACLCPRGSLAQDHKANGRHRRWENARVQGLFFGKGDQDVKYIQDE